MKLITTLIIILISSNIISQVEEIIIEEIATNNVKKDTLNWGETPDGWTSHASSIFSIAFPDGWSIKNIDGVDTGFDIDLSVKNNNLIHVFQYHAVPDKENNINRSIWAFLKTINEKAASSNLYKSHFSEIQYYYTNFSFDSEWTSYSYFTRHNGKLYWFSFFTKKTYDYKLQDPFNEIIKTVKWI